MADKTLLIVAGLGALYFLMKPNSAFAYPSQPGTHPATGGSPGSGGSGSGGGFSFGSGGGSGTSSGGGSTSYPYKPTPSSTVINCPGAPGCPGYDVPNDSGNPCDPSSVAYDVQLCNVMNGTDSLDICDPASYYYDAQHCTGSDAASNYPIDSGDPCDPSSYAFDPTICSGVPSGTMNYDGGQTFESFPPEFT